MLIVASTFLSIYTIKKFVKNSFNFVTKLNFDNFHSRKYSFCNYSRNKKNKHKYNNSKKQVNR